MAILTQQDNPEEREIVEKVNYLASVFIPSINRINEAVYNLKPSWLAAKLLISDVPEEWKPEIEKALQDEEDAYRKVRKDWQKAFARGTPASDKLEGQKAILEAEQIYSMNVKAIIISLLNKKVGLFQTRAKLPTASIDLYEAMGIKETHDDDD